MLPARRFLVALTLSMSVFAAIVAPRRARADDPYTFVVYGDTRSNPKVHSQVLTKIIATKPEFVLQTGDLVANGRDPKQWKEFDGITKPLHDAHIPYYPARGNHDVGDYYPDEVTEPFDSGNKYYYAFTRHGSRFICVDSMDPNGLDMSSPQYQWLLHELETAHKSARHVFVMFHEGAYTVGPHGPNAQAVQYLVPLFVKYRPTAVFTGHDHLYYRTIRDGVHYFVTGGGGAPLYDPDNADLAIPGDVYDKEYHYIKVVIDGMSVTATAYNLAGKVIDTVTWTG